MRLHIAPVLLAGVLFLASHTPTRAGSLQVEPVLVDVIAPGAASTMTLRNQGDTPVDAQIRVFRWSQADGQEKLDPTNDVVASPPAVTLAPKSDRIVRIVRVSKAPVVGEENYRLFIDQLPDPAQQQNGVVKFLVRRSIPVFFGAPNKVAPAVVWSASVTGDTITVTSRNSGERRLRVAALALHDDKGRTISFGNGLVGYVLGQATMRWTAPGARGFAASGSASISAQSESGPIHAVATVASPH
jgi:fimbrial chaperone protein